jgi:hypothetical protein
METGPATETYRRSLLQSLPNRKTQVVVDAALDQRDHIDRLKDIIYHP